ncbi:MAG: OmpA family protein [Chitinophagaceae bacterium]
MNRFQREMERLQDKHRSLKKQNNEMRRLYLSAENANRHPVRIEVSGGHHNPVTVLPIPIPYNRNNNTLQKNLPPSPRIDSIYIHDTISAKEDTTGNYAFVSWLLSHTSKHTTPHFTYKRIPQPVKSIAITEPPLTIELSAIPSIKIFFTLNGAKVDKRYYSELNFVAASLKQHKNYKIKLSGYTDNTGPAAFNLQLSKKRADVVRQYLLHQGVLPNQIVTEFFGEQSPSSPNQNTEGKVLNRRVEIKFIQNK